MTPGEGGRAPRPLGVTVLALLLLAAGAARLAWCLLVAARFRGELHEPANLFFLAAGILPAVWVSLTGLGLLRGRAWARASFFALAALSLIMVAGALSGPLDSREAKLAAGSFASVFLVAAGGTWYLLGARASGWLR